MSLEAVLVAGTVVAFSTDDGTTWTDIPGVMSVGALGLMSEAKEKTTLADTSKKYGAGLQDSPDKAIKGQYFGSDTDQRAFITQCKNRAEFLMRVTFPDIPSGGTTGTVAQFTFKALGFEVDENSAEDWMMFTANGKQNGDVTWIDPA